MYAVLSVAAMTLLPVPTAAKDERLYEMRIYYAAEGKFDAMNARFRDHTLKLFAKHGMTNVGYFWPVNNPDNKLIYFLAFPSKEARGESWKKFLADPEWQAVYKESEKNGKLVAKIESYLMNATDYSPELKIESLGNRIFELRDYTATKGNLAALNGRFREHTRKLFEKHGMTNVIYWNLASDQQNADTKLIYLLAHQSEEAAKASFAAFRQDPEWIQARTASEEKAGGSLTEPKGGVVSTFLKPTDYSPLK